MGVATFLSRLLIMSVIICSPLAAADHELLQSKDVNKIMKQIFDQHVDKKEISNSILEKSFKVYIDQFDPQRIYLTEKDINPYMHLSNTQISNIISQYKNNQFPEYVDLNNTIQKAINRARSIRTQLEQGESSDIFNTSSRFFSNGYDDWRDADLNKTFPSDETKLKERIKNYLAQLIANQRKRFGDAAILGNQTRTLAFIEKQLREHENQYLFVLENGQPMVEAEKQNALAMHILKSLANSLDAHTTVLNPAEVYDMRLRLEKEVQGIGILLNASKNGNIIVSQIIDGGPAARSGLIKLGDTIIQIDGQSVQNKPLDNVMNLIEGKNGSKINLVIQRQIQENSQPTQKQFNVSLIRQAISVNEDRVQSNYISLGDGIIGVIRLDTFYQSDNGITSENDVREAIQKLDKKGNMRALILDFRENSGGFLSQAVKVAGLFMTNGVVVISKYFNGDEHFYRDMDGKIAYDGPLIILTSKATASAAEIVAQALQDYGLALIVGDPHTYGKGTIQSQTVTDHQSATYFKVTVGKYYTVSGKTPQIQGVKADIVVPSQFAHENIGEEYLEFPLKQDVITSSYDDKLQDVAPNLKDWYMHYYVPTIQHKKDLWRSMLPTLKNNSSFRLANNKDYQLFINGHGISTKRNIEDLQMSETINIAKDMVLLNSQQHHGGQSLEDATTASSSSRQLQK